MRWSFDYKTDHRLKSLNFSPEMNTINNKVQAAESDSLKLKQFTKQMLFGYLGVQQPADVRAVQNQSSVRTGAFALGYDRVLDVDPGAPLWNPFLRAVPSQ